MTTFRPPLGWNTAREPGKRPDLSGFHWLDKVVKTTRDYWLKIHWATPPWLTDEQLAQMKAIYESADPEHEHVDHTVPLKHPLVCGLHVPWNLEVITARDNLAKSNNYWPDCPDHLCPVKNATIDLVEMIEAHGQLSLLPCDTLIGA